MIWQVLVAISVITLSISILLQRVLLHNDKTDPIAYVIVFNAAVGTLIGLYALIAGFELPDFARFWFAILAATACFGLGHIMYAKSLQILEASVFSILFSTNFAWVMILGLVIFNESINILQIIGALFVFASIFLISERQGKIKIDQGIIFGLTTGLLFGLATLAWVYVGRHTDAASWTSLTFIAPSILVLAAKPASVRHIRPLLQGDTLKRIMLLAVLFGISAVTLQKAFQTGDISRVAPLQASNIIVTVLLAIVFLRERTRLRRKAAAALVCFLGVVLVV